MSLSRKRGNSRKTSKPGKPSQSIKRLGQHSSHISSKRRPTCRNVSKPPVKGGYHTGAANNAIKMSVAFANLAQTMTDDCAILTNLTTVSSTLTKQVALYTNRPSDNEADNMSLQTTMMKL